MRDAPVRAGALSEKLTIERGETATGAYRNQVTVWTPRFDIRAELLEDVREEEPIEAGSRITIKASFLIRFVADLKMTDRLIWGGERFNIVGLKVLGRRQAIQIDAKRIGP